MVALTFALAHSTPAVAQGGAFLLAPFGARSVGRGESVAADTALGTEGVWFNSAALARMGSREFAFHHGTSVLGSTFMLSGAIPSRALGTLGASAYRYQIDAQESTDELGNPIGVLIFNNSIYAASYASAIGKRFSLGITYKFISSRQQCSGLCPRFTPIQGSSSALDVGAQYILTTPFPISIGVSARNFGQKLQFKDRAQADALPRVIQVGLITRIPIRNLNEAGATLDVSADVSQVSYPNASFAAVGGALNYRDQVFLRAGYKQISGEGGGPSIGFGLQRGAFGLDLSRRFDDFSAAVGAASPTYVALRARF